MRIEVENVIQKIDLGNYAPAYAGQVLQVWANPPREFRRVRETLLLNYVRIMKSGGVWNALRLRVQIWRESFWLARLWSKGEKQNRWSAREVYWLRNREPALYEFMVRESMKAVDEYRASKKK